MKALVTGASSGIGREMAKYLSSLGYDLIIVARREDALIELKNELKTKVNVINCDVSKKENCFELYNKVKNQNIDILINNAGFGVFGKFNETDLEKEISLIDTNITAVHILTKLFLKDMVNRNSGYILNVSSISGFLTGPLMSSYYASKNYVTRLSLAIARELKKNKSNVKISVLCPGPVETNFNNVAGVHFGIKPLTSPYVAKYAIDKMLKNKKIIIPGIKIKLLRICAKIVPESILENCVYLMQTKKINNKN